MSSLSDEIDRLVAQRAAGHLSDAEFEAAKARVLGATPTDRVHPVGEAYANVGSLRRSLSDRWIGGVCGGLARMFGVESWLVRLIFVVLILFCGIGLVPYILLWIFVPLEGRS
jgi:phage shock protein C